MSVLFLQDFSTPSESVLGGGGEGSRATVSEKMISQMPESSRK